MASDKQILGGLLLGLSRGAETFLQVRQQQKDEERQDELFDIRLRDAKIEEESSRLRLQLLQEEVKRNPGRLDLQRQLNEALLEQRQAAIEANEAEAAASGQRAQVDLLRIQDLRRDAKRDIRQDVTDQLIPLQQKFREISDVVALGAQFAPDEAQRIREFMNLTPRQAQNQGLEDVLRDVHADSRSLAALSAGPLGVESQGTLSAPSIFAMADRIGAQEEAIGEKLEILNQQELVIRDFIADQQDIVGTLPTEQQDAMRQSIATSQQDLLTIKSAQADLLNASSKFVARTPREFEEMELTAGGGTQPSPIGSEGVPRAGVVKTGLFPTPGPPSAEPQGTPIADAVQVGFEAVTTSGPGNMKAFLADTARFHVGQLTEEDVESLAAIRTVFGGLQKQPGTFFGGRQGGILETLFTPLKSFEAIGVPFGPFSEENLKSPERFAQAMKNGIKDPLSGQTVLPSDFTFEMSPRHQKMALGSMTLELRAAYDNLGDDNSRKAMLITLAGSLGMGFESLSPHAGTPDNPRKIGEGSVVNALSFFPQGAQGLFNNLSWLDTAVAGLGSVPSAVTKSLPVLRFVNSTIGGPFRLGGKALGKVKESVVGAKEFIGAIRSAGPLRRGLRPPPIPAAAARTAQPLGLQVRPLQIGQQGFTRGPLRTPSPLARPPAQLGGPARPQQITGAPALRLPAPPPPAVSNIGVRPGQIAGQAVQRVEPTSAAQTNELLRRLTEMLR